MALDKAIEHGKEKRKPYRGAKAVDCTCRNHGTCKWCMENRKHKFRDRHPDGGEYTSEVDMIGESYSPFCRYCGGVDTMMPGKSMIFCGIDDRWHNVTAGECFGKCKKQAVIDGTEPAKWIEPKEE